MKILGFQKHPNISQVNMTGQEIDMVRKMFEDRLSDSQGLKEDISERGEQIQIVGASCKSAQFSV